MTTEQSVQRRSFEAAVAHLAFAMDVPAGFMQVPVSGEGVNFDDPGQSAPLAVLSNPAVDAVIAVAARPAYPAGGVLQWVRQLAERFKMDLQHVLVREVGSPPTHPGVTAFGAQRRDGKKRSFMLAAFEDGGWFVTAHGSCPADRWAECGNRMAEAVESVVLRSARGGRFPVDEPLPERWDRPSRSKVQEDYERAAQERSERRAPAVAKARELIWSGRYDEAEQALRSVDQSIEGYVEVSRLFERRLREVVMAGRVKTERAAVEDLFRRALSWAQGCYPEPHTEIEAENYSAGRDEDRARLVGVLGYDPDRGAAR